MSSELSVVGGHIFVDEADDGIMLTTYGEGGSTQVTLGADEADELASRLSVASRRQRTREAVSAVDYSDFPLSGMFLDGVDGSSG